MSDRLPSDHDAVDSHRVHLSRIGGTGRLQIPLPEGVEFEAGDTLSLSLAGEQFFSQVVETLDGTPVLQHAAPNRRLARRREGENAFHTWLDEIDLAAGEPLVFDVLRAGYAVGLREPGQRVVYEPPEPPDRSLADIADSLENG